MLRRQTMVPFLLFCATLLTGCDLMGMAHRPPTVLTQIKVERQPVNLSEFQCPEMPRPPKAVTQLDVAIFIVDQDAWMHACAAEVEEMKEALRPSTEAATP